MRKAPRAMLLVVLAVLSSAFIGIVSTITAALTLAATALIVPGTGTHNITTVMGYKENARDRFIAPADPFCTAANGCALVGIDYPASFWPLPFPNWCPGFTCDTWNVSVATGVANLNSELLNQLANPTPNNQQIVLFGYSQGGAVVSKEMYNLANLDPATKARISVVTIGNIDNPQGLWTRLSFLPTIPILNVTFGPVLPTNIGIKSTNYVFEYDPVGDAPLYWGNPLAMLNALAAFQYVHGYYLVPNSNDPTSTLPYGYTDATLAAAIADPNNSRTYQDATFVLIPQQGTLPLMQPIVDIASATGTTPLVKPIVDLISPTLKVLINLGYDRTINPGIPMTLSILPFNPFQNWGQVGVNLVAAVGQGISDAVNDVTGTPTPLAPTTPAPLNTSSLNAAPLKAAVPSTDTSSTLSTTKTTTSLVQQGSVLAKQLAQTTKPGKTPVTDSTSGSAKTTGTGTAGANGATTKGGTTPTTGNTTTAGGTTATTGGGTTTTGASTGESGPSTGTSSGTTGKAAA